MLEYLGSQLHYRCSFELVRKKGVVVGWDDIVKTIRDWLSRRCGRQQGLGRQWFFTGGDWKMPTNPRFRVETAMAVGAGTQRSPQYWALRYEHPCDDVSFRQWQTDIGVTAVGSDRFRFVLATTHRLKSGYIGDEPQVPVPSAPGIVTTFLTCPRWDAYCGSELLTTLPTQLKAGEGHILRKKLETVDRPPLVLVSMRYETQQFTVDPTKLSKLLAGTALVYVAESSEVDKELEWLLPRPFRCWNGMVRVYQPGAVLDHETDARRHRFFTSEDIERRSAAGTQEIIVRGLGRRGRISGWEAVGSIEDVTSKDRESRLAQLRAEAVAGQGSAELVDLLESDNEVLGTKVKELTGFCDVLQDQNTQLVEQIDALEYEKQSLKAHLDRLGARKHGDDESESELAKAFRAWLDKRATLEDGLTLISGLYPDRVAVLDSARRSAKAAERFEEGQKACELMVKFATTYWSMLCEGKGATNGRQVFGEAFAGKESETVENNSRARQLRTFEYKSTPVEMMSHLKIGVKPSVAKTWRLHFHWDSAEKKLVIGHCGRHLDHK